MLLMGCFSIYAGALYNDCFSQSFTVFKSGWSCQFSAAEFATKPVFLLEPTDFDRPYYFGIDPAWQVCTFIKYFVVHNVVGT
jgi:V-type H+-transporting ATPase subunit a